MPARLPPIPRRFSSSRQTAVSGGAVPSSSTTPLYGSSSTLAWPTRIVVVIASFNGTLIKPDQRRSKLWRMQHDPSNWHRNTSNVTFVVYQRTNPRGLNYSPNFGFEGCVSRIASARSRQVNPGGSIRRPPGGCRLLALFPRPCLGCLLLTPTSLGGAPPSCSTAPLLLRSGVVVQFIVDHYAALPDVSIFVQERAEQHNPQWLNWIGCLRPNVSYAPMTHARLSRLYRANAQTDPGTQRDDAITEQCWRDMLEAFGVPLLLPREQPILAYFQGATFAASRDLLRSTPLAAWRRVHLMMAGV